MVFEHQMQMMNLADRRRMGDAHRAPGRAPPERSRHSRGGGAAGRLHAVCRRGADRLTDEGRVGNFAEAFSARGPNDSKGRSLRRLDLRTRLFRYPCSYLIYSPQFERLPAEAQTASTHG